MRTPMPDRSAPVFCVLLAGGRGSRLHELTLAQCKPAVAFGAGRLVDFTLANVRRSGLRQVLVATQYLPGALVRHLDTVWRPHFGPGLTARDGGELTGGGYAGTADAVRANLPEILASGAREILVLSADHVYRMDYRPMIERHRARAAKVTLAALEVPLAEARAFGVLSADDAGGITAFLEKPRSPVAAPGNPQMALASMGIYVFDTEWLTSVLADPRLCDFGNDLLPLAVDQGVAQVFPAAAADPAAFYWRDVGTLDSYRRTRLDFLSTRTAPFDPPMALAPGGDVLDAAARGTVLLEGARIAGRARVSNTILGPGAVVPTGAVIGEDPDEDRRWFRVTPQGTVLVTQAMLARQREEKQRPLSIGLARLAAVAGG